MPTLAEVREEIAAKSQALHKLFEQAGPEMDMTKVTDLTGDSATKAAEFKRRNDELTALGKQRDELTDWDAMRDRARKEHEHASRPVGPMVHPNGTQNGHQEPAQKSLRQIIAESPEYKAFVERGANGTARIHVAVPDTKTLITLTTISPQARRQAPVDMALEERTVGDLMMQGTTDSTTIEYYEETTVTNNAAAVAEGATKPESALAWTLRTETVRDIAHWIPATRQALRDVSFLESQIRGRLTFGVQRAEEAELLSGSGVAPHLTGLLNRSGIQTQAKGADPVPDAIFKAMQKVRGAAGAGFAEPTAVVLHPNDWTDIRLLRTADGIYIWGSPSDAGPERIWSKEVRQTTGITEGTGLTGAFRPFAEVVRREGITIEVSTEHSTYFIENKVAIRAEEALTLAVYRPSAFATVTGI
jgi:HK97 family phage major capsid protein